MKHKPLLVAGAGLVAICVVACSGQTSNSSSTQDVGTLASVEVGDKWGFIDAKGKVVIRADPLGENASPAGWLVPVPSTVFAFDSSNLFSRLATPSFHA